MATNIWLELPVEAGGGPSPGVLSLNGLTGNLAIVTGTSGTDFAVVPSGATITLNLPVASALNTGKLSSADWSTFNSKQPAGNYITALTGDVTATGPGSVAATIAAGAITNAKVNAAAAIDYSKLNLSNSIVNADINTSAAIAYSKLNLSNSIVNADINSAANISFSKLAALTNAHILVGSAGNVATDVAVSGDMTLTNTGSLTINNLAVSTGKIAANAVTNSKLAQMAANTIKGNALGVTSDPQDLTAAQVNAILGVTPGVGPTTNKNANFTILNTDVSQTYLMNTSGGSFTATLPPASTTPNGTSHTFKDAAGTAEQFPFTVSPTGADLVEGLNSPRTYSTNWGAVTYICDGVSKWFARHSRSRISQQLFLSSGTWTAPAGVTKIRVRARPGAGGGGGGGAGGTGFSGSPGGGGGGGRGGGAGGSASIIEAYINVVPGTTYNVTIGAGGTGGAGGTTGAGSAGTSGGLSQFDGIIFGRTVPVIGASGGTGGGVGGNGTGAAGGGAGTSGGAAGTNYGDKVDTPSAALNGGAGGTITGANGTSVGNTLATVPLYFGTAQVGANGGAGGAGAGGTNGGGGGGGSGGGAGYPETYSLDGAPAASGGAPGNGGQGGIANAAGAGGAGSPGQPGTDGFGGMGGGGGGAGGGGGSGSAGAGARGTGGAGGNGSNGMMLIEWVG